MMNRIEKAVAFATKAHAGQYRKGTDRPYILHPIETMAIITRLVRYDEDLIAAAVLHDVVAARKGIRPSRFRAGSLCDRG